MKNIFIITFIVSLIFSFGSRNFGYSHYKIDSDENTLFVSGISKQSKEEALINALINLQYEDNVTVNTQINSEGFGSSNTNESFSIGKIELRNDLQSSFEENLGKSIARNIELLFDDMSILYQYQSSYIELTKVSNQESSYFEKRISFTDGMNFFKYEAKLENEKFLESSEGEMGDNFFDSIIDELKKNDITLHKMVIVDSKFKDWYYKNLRMGEVIIILKKDI